jgi:hypothetical protein
MPIDMKLVQRDRVIRAVTSIRPAIAVKEADVVALDRICQSLVDVEEAKQMLCAAGHGFPSQTLPDLVRVALGIKP